ncbi:sulfatase [Adhaeretor mobilis]|uniref:Arylsulfatase n=1 Tax=Adhaeretor mobilis TaxID=1930276 RepID=A0A517MPP8_9BACT|nr:sulfatase [Adhaeretor mobilis]QDS96842.1 Arylsulfatase [Adhaeretor mobilis]
MATRTLLFLLTTFTLVIGSTPLQAKKAPLNVLLICVDDLRPELACYGVDYIHSPNIDRLATEGRLFRRHFVQAPTCGASRYALLTGCYGPGGNGALFQRAAKLEAKSAEVLPSMPAWFRQQGYTTVSVGKVSHHPGGRGGPDWDDESQLEMPDAWDRHLLPSGPWQHPRGWMHGLANGEIRQQNGGMDVFQSLAGPDTIYPDGVSLDVALEQLDELTAKPSQPFFLAVGILRPHLPFGAPAKYMKPYENVTLPPTPHPNKPAGKTTWHRSGEFMSYNRWERNPNDDPAFAIEVRKHYAACVSYADAQVGRLTKALSDSDAAQNTIVVLWGDHGWHLGEHAVWGKHTLFEESLHSPLIIRYPGIKQAGQATDALVETRDLYPTLCDLAGIAPPAFLIDNPLASVSLRPQLEDPSTKGHAAVSYNKANQTLRTESHRLIVHNDGSSELYDHTSAAKETKNIAANEPELVESLKERLRERLGRSQESAATR